MPETDKNVKPMKSSNARDHLANERTFLAWARTSLGIMAFGFVIEKFALFIKQIGLLLGRQQLPLETSASSSLQGYSGIFGEVLVTLGVFLCLFAFANYKKVEKQIDDETYHPSTLLNLILTLSVILIGFFLVSYLNTSI